MPEAESTLFNGVFEISGAGYGSTYLSIYSMPPSPDQLHEIARLKGEGRIPRILRARVRYRLEYIDKRTLVYWGYRLYLIDCRGEEVLVRRFMETPWDRRPVDEGEVDVSNLFNCTAPAFGLGGAKLELTRTTTTGTDRFNVYVTLWMSWGW